VSLAENNSTGIRPSPSHAISYNSSAFLFDRKQMRRGAIYDVSRKLIHNSGETETIGLRHRGCNLYVPDINKFAPDLWKGNS